jgi:predicted Zn-dependent protease
MILVADVMQSEQRYSESEKLLRKALDGDPKNQSALLMLGRALITQGAFVDAERVLRTSTEFNPQGFMGYSLLGTLYTRQGKFEMAENALLQSLKYVSTLEKRGLSQQFEAVGDGYAKAGNRSSERAYRQGAALDPENEKLAAKISKMPRN